MAASIAVVGVLAVAALLWRATRDDEDSRREAATGGQVTERPGDPFDPNEPEFEDALRSFYQEFLHATDVHRVPDDLAREYGSGLADLAEPPVVARYDAWRAANEALAADDFRRVTGFRSFANILDIGVDGAKVTIRDCTDEKEVAGIHEVNSYVTRVVQVGSFGGLYRVTDVDVQHEGRIDSPGYGCIPGPMAKKAADTVRTVVNEFRAAQADPRAGLPPALDAVVAGDLEAELVSSLAEQAAQSVSITSPSDAELTVLGLDPRLLGEVAVVSACITYPDGVVLRKLPSGEVLRDALRSGAQSKVTYAVRLNDVGGPVAYSILSDETPTKC